MQSYSCAPESLPDPTSNRPFHIRYQQHHYCMIPKIHFGDLGTASPVGRVRDSLGYGTNPLILPDTGCRAIFCTMAGLHPTGTSSRCGRTRLPSQWGSSQGAQSKAGITDNLPAATTDRVSHTEYSSVMKERNLAICENTGGHRRRYAK